LGSAMVARYATRSRPPSGSIVRSPCSAQPCAFAVTSSCLVYDINTFLWSNSCKRNGKGQTLVMIAKGSAELAKSLKTCLSRVSKPYVQTCQRPPRIPRLQRSTNLSGSHVSSQSRRSVRLVQRRSKHPPNRNRYGRGRRSGVRPERSPPPNSVASAP
jgi:hypothetical protein